MARDYTRQEVLDIIEREANERAIPRDDFLRFAAIETGNTFDENARNPSGAKGLFQFMPDTARQYGISGQEFDPVANTDAAARLYLSNRRELERAHERNDRPYLSGSAQPDGMDLYMAHQQGAGGYASIQNAIATGEFSLDGTRRNILGNIPGERDRQGNLTTGAREFQEITGRSISEFRQMPDRDMAQTFATYWDGKFDRVRIQEKGIEPIANGQRTQSTPGQTTQTPAASNALADNALTQGERGRDVSGLQQSLNELSYRDERGQPLETRSGIYGAHTAAAVRSFQQANNLPPTGVADMRTLEAIGKQMELPTDQRTRPAATPTQNAPQTPQQTTQSGEGHWPAPGNTSINRADKPREGRGEFGTPRGNHSHGGIDIQGNVGDPIAAYAGGTVRVQRNNGDAGNTVTIDHGGGVTTRYFHLKDINVQNGQHVDAGVQIGTMGRSGNTPQAGDTHLHFEMHRNGRKVDPMQYLQVPGREQSDRQQSGVTQPTTNGGALRRDDNGTAVRDVQRQLAGLGYQGADGKPLSADGDFGRNTKHAVENYQRAHGLQPVDGIVGKDTFAALKQSQQQPLVSETTHRDNPLFRDLQGRMSGATAEQVAQTLQSAKANGITRPDQVQDATVRDNVAYVTGTTPGFRARVELQEQPPSLQATTQQVDAQNQRQQGQDQQQIQQQQDRQARGGMMA